MNKTKKTFLLLLVSIMCMSLVLIPSFQVQAAESNSVQVWLTDISSNKWVEQQNDVLFQTVQTTNPLTINVDASRKYQEVQGFGAGMTDSSAWLIWSKMSESQRTELMSNLFDPSTGIGLSLLRTPMGATDFNASGNYSYDDMPAGETDPTLSNFSIEHDEAYIIPALKEALSLNPSMKIMATPWSPPGWMKTSDSMIGGTLKSEYYSALANYFVKYVQAFDNAGVPISYITPQNEPMGTPTYPGMFLSAYQESTLIKEMGEAFAANNISTKILAWDHNWDVPSYPEKIFSDPSVTEYTYGTGWHIYSGDPISQTLVHNDYPSKRSFITEATGGTWQANTQEAFYDSLNTWIINGMRNWADGVVLWNIALDTDGGPLNSDTDGEAWVRGLTTIDPDSGEVSYNVDYYALAHASKFVKPGAYRIYSNTFGEGSIENVAFQNPDGSKVLIAYNSGSDSKTFSVADVTQSFDYTLNAGNAVTFKWEGPQQSGTTPAAASVTDATYDFRFSDSAIITYDPALLDFQNTIPTGNSSVTYSLPVGASIQTAGTVLDRSGWTVTASSNSVGDGTGNASGDAAANAIDGDIDSRWTNGHGLKNGDWYQIDLGSPASFDQIVLENGVNSSFDYVTKYQVYVSNDGVNWGSAIANGSGGIGDITITLPTQSAQYIRIVSTGTSGFWWSIGEINVYGSSNETGSIAAPTAVSNGLELQNWTSTEGAKVTVVYNGTGGSQSFPISTDSSFTYTLPDGTSAMFTTKDSSSFPTPAFGSLTPNEGIVGYKVTIDGTNFGDLQRLGTVNFGSIPANISSWSDSSISAYVPDGLQSGSVAVSVYGNDGSYAGGSSFNVKDLPAALSKTGWTATATDISPWGDGNPENMIDNNTNTRYSSGTGQYNGLSFTVDMGQTQTFNKIMVDSGSSIGDYARSSDVYVSSDGIDWTKVSSIVSDGQQVQLAAFETQTARYIKVVNTGTVGTWWSITEFNVYNTRTSWTATATDVSPWGDVPGNMLDGNAETRYSSGTGQYNGLSFTVDMGQTEAFNKIVIDSGSGSNDYTRSADVFVSTDGTDWTKVSSITGSGPVQEVTFETQTARYIKVVNTGTEGYWWSVAEFDAFIAPTDYRAGWTATATDVSPWGDVPGNMLDNNASTRYSSGTGQYDGLSFTVDMGQTDTFDKIVIDSGSGSNDYARSSDVFVSTDGTNWTKVTSVTGSGPVQEVTFSSQTARYIKVVVTGSEDYWWSVVEFDVYDTRANWTVTATDVSPWGDVPGNMLDGNAETRYSSGTGQYNGLSFTVDMGQTEAFNKIVIDSGSGSNDYTRSADVFVSTDGTDWTKVSSITGSGPVQEVTFQAQTARYIKVVVTGNEGYWWSVAEFNVYNEEDTDYRANWTATATDVSPWGDVPGNMLDGNPDTRYSSGTGQYDGLSFTVDMSQTETFNKIVIDSGSGSNDYARNSDVFVSTDGTNWTKVTSVTGSGPVQEVTFQTQTARYIKVVVTGTEGYWWSVADFNVYNEENTNYRAGWTATATDVSPWGDVPGNMLDNNASTQYSSGTGQYDGLSFTVDMGQSDTFNKIVIDSGSGSNDYARSSDVFVSTDGISWTKVTSVTGSGPVQEVTFQPQTARYIKVVVTGTEGYWWSVAEFDVYSTAEEPQNIYQEVYFKHEGEKRASLTAQDTVKTITLEAWGKTIADGQADVNITSDATWSVQSGQDVVSVNNGIVTINKDGNAVVKITYGEKQASLSLVINKTTTVPAPDPEEEPETIHNPDGSTTNIDGSRAVTEYSADIISSKIAAINQKSIKKITVTLPDTSAAINELVFAADAVEKIVNEKLDLKVELENTSLSIPSSVLKEISADLKIEIKTLTDTEKQIVLTNLNGLKATGPVIEFTLTSVEGNVQNSVTKFKEKVTIEIDAEGSSNTDTKKLGIYYLDETSGKWIYVGGKYNSATGKVEAKTGHFTKFAVMEYSKSFSDIGSTHWAKANIEVMAAMYITSGISETRFDPAGKVTRAQFATFLVRALGIDLPAYKGTFTDVPEGQWYTEYVEAAQASGIINGAGNNRFAPNEEITREQMAVMVMNAYAYATAQTANTVGKDVNTGFDDLDQAASWSKDAIKASFKLGIINGVNKSSYEPGMLAQRDQAASIIYRFLEAIGEL